MWRPTWRPCAELAGAIAPAVALANHLVMGPVILARGAARARSPTRSRSTAARSSTPSSPTQSASWRPRARAWRAQAGCSWARATRPRACGRRSPMPRSPGAPAWARRASTSALRATRAARGRGRACAARRAAARRRARSRAQERSTERLQRATRAPRRAALERPGSAARPARRVRGQADRQQGRRPAARGVAARARAVPRGAARASSASAPTARRWSALLTALAARRSADGAGARAGRSRAGGALGARRRPLRHLLAFLDGLAGRARASAISRPRARLGERVVFTGRLEHEELAELLPACEALVVPSTFPEAFGMVAAEAAACGALPVSAAHSGLAEVSEALARARARGRRRMPFLPGRRRGRGGASRSVW